MDGGDSYYCSSYLLLHDNIATLFVALIKTTHISYLMVSVSQKSRHGSAGPLQGSSQDVGRAAVSSELGRGRIYFLVHMIVGSIQFPVDSVSCWLWAPQLLAT